MKPHDHHCDSCNSTLKSRLFCSACERLQQLQDQETYFSIFDQPVSFHIDPASIERVFDDLVMKLHPDFFAQADERDQALSLQHTSLLHEAKACLLNPFERGKYLLSLLYPGQAVPLGNPPPAFMVEMFDFQEALDDLAQGKGNSPNLQTHLQELHTRLLQYLTTAFAQLLHHPDDANLLDRIREELAKVKFVINLQARFKEIQKEAAWNP